MGISMPRRLIAMPAAGATLSTSIAAPRQGSGSRRQGGAAAWRRHDRYKRGGAGPTRLADQRARPPVQEDRDHQALPRATPACAYLEPERDRTVRATRSASHRASPASGCRASIPSAPGTDPGQGSPAGTPVRTGVIAPIPNTWHPGLPAPAAPPIHGVNGTTIVRAGTGPAVIGGGARTATGINGTTFRPRY